MKWKYHFQVFYISSILNAFYNAKGKQGNIYTYKIDKLGY